MAFIYNFGLSDTDFEDGGTTSGYSPEQFAYGGEITFAEAGTINQLGTKGRADTVPVAIKIALYETDGTLVAGTSTTLNLNTDGAFSSWEDSATFTPVAVSATTYVILYSAEDNTAEYRFDTGQDGSYATEAYSTFPASSETITVGGDTGQGYPGRANFTAGGATISDVNL